MRIKSDILLFHCLPAFNYFKAHSFTLPMRKSCWNYRSCHIYCFLKFWKTFGNFFKHVCYINSVAFSANVFQQALAILVFVHCITLHLSSRKLPSDMVLKIIGFILVINRCANYDTDVAFEFCVVSFTAYSVVSLNSYHIVIRCQFRGWLWFLCCLDIIFT